MIKIIKSPNGNEIIRIKCRKCDTLWMLSDVSSSLWLTKVKWNNCFSGVEVLLSACPVISLVLWTVVWYWILLCMVTLVKHLGEHHLNYCWKVELLQLEDGKQCQSCAWVIPCPVLFAGSAPALSPRMTKGTSTMGGTWITLLWIFWARSRWMCSF